MNIYVIFDDSNLPRWKFTNWMKSGISYIRNIITLNANCIVYKYTKTKKDKSDNNTSIGHAKCWTL